MINLPSVSSTPPAQQQSINLCVCQIQGSCLSACQTVNFILVSPAQGLNYSGRSVDVEWMN